MTVAHTLTYGNFLIKLGNGESPESFAAPCGLTTRGFNQTAATNDTIVPQCPPNEDDPAYVERDVNSLSSELSGSGVLALESLSTWQEWFDSAAQKNCEIIVTDTTYGGHWLGAFILTAFNITANRGAKVDIALTMQSTGQWTWHAGT